MTVARSLAEFLTQVSYDDLPPQAVEHAAMLIASTIASAAWGSGITSATIIRALARVRGGTPEASLWFDQGPKLPAADAAQVNAVMSDAAASDDSDLRNIVHVGTTLVATSLVIGYRAGPISWRADAASVLTGRMPRYALAVIRRAGHRVAQVAGKRRGLVTAARGLADVALFAGLEAVGVAYILRVKRGTMVRMNGGWCTWHTLRVHGHHRPRSVGGVLYCPRAPHAVWLTMSRARDKAGHWGIWSLGSNRSHPADKAAADYRPRSGGEAGLRDAKWWWGFAHARITCVHAWSRRFALFAIALMMVATLATTWLLGPRKRASALLRRVMSRRQKRCALGLISAMVSLLIQEGSLYEHLSPHVKLKLEGQ